jgi:hypothetical protein
LYPTRSFLFSEACGIVSFPSSIVNKHTRGPVDKRTRSAVHEKDMHLAWSMHTNREGHFNVAGSGWTGDEHR